MACWDFSFLVYWYAPSKCLVDFVVLEMFSETLNQARNTNNSSRGTVLRISQDSKYLSISKSQHIEIFQSQKKNIEKAFLLLFKMISILSPFLQKDETSWEEASNHNVAILLFGLCPVVHELPGPPNWVCPHLGHDMSTLSVGIAIFLSSQPMQQLARKSRTVWTAALWTQRIEEASSKPWIKVWFIQGRNWELGCLDSEEPME